MLKSLIPYQDYLQKVDDKIKEWTDCSTKTTKIATQHLLQAGGKRIRPLLLILSAKSFGFQQKEQDKIISIAAAVEMLHMATLTHDDIVDDTEERRGQKSIKEKWGEGGAVLIGDYMFVRAFNKFVEHGSKTLVKEASSMTYKMCDGELEQLFSEYDFDMTEDDYYDIIHKKTALFFKFCCQAGAMVAGADKKSIKIMGDYGLNIGMAFQIRDDMLDLAGKKENTGKPLVSDLKEGIITLPLFYLLKQETHAARKAKELLEKGKENKPTRENLNILQSLIIEHGGISYAQKQAENFARSAILALEGLEITNAGQEKSNALSILREIAEYIIEREQ